MCRDCKLACGVELCVVLMPSAALHPLVCRDTHALSLSQYTRTAHLACMLPWLFAHLPHQQTLHAPTTPRRRPNNSASTRTPSTRSVCRRCSGRSSRQTTTSDSTCRSSKSASPTRSTFALTCSQGMRLCGTAWWSTGASRASTLDAGVFARVVCVVLRRVVL